MFKFLTLFLVCISLQAQVKDSEAVLKLVGKELTATQAKDLLKFIEKKTKGADLSKGNHRAIIQKYKHGKPRQLRC